MGDDVMRIPAAEGRDVIPSGDAGRFEQARQDALRDAGRRARETAERLRAAARGEVEKCSCRYCQRPVRH